MLLCILVQLAAHARDGDGVRLYQSLYETGLRNQIPRSVIDDLVRIYSYDVDFQRKAQPGDSFEVLYSGDDEAGGDAQRAGIPSRRGEARPCFGSRRQRGW